MERRAKGRERAKSEGQRAKSRAPKREQRGQESGIRGQKSVVSGADSRWAAAVLGRNGSYQTQVKAESRDESPKSQVNNKERFAHKTCRFSAAASGAQSSTKPDYREHCAVFLPFRCGRSGRSSKSALA